MHVLDANEIFGMTFYTADRILEEGGTNGPDALALYVKLIKQTRIQQTNQTKSLDKFLEEGLGWGYKRLKNAKDILKGLGLIDSIDVRDKLGKIVGHYVRVNFLINEQKVRNAGITYNLSTTYSESNVDESQLWLNEHKCLKYTNINAGSTQIENISSKEEIETSSITKDINNLISELKQECDNLGIAYDKTKERQFAKHILSAKEYGGFCEKVGMGRQEFASNILKASVLINFWKGACAGPMRIYQNYSEVYNKTKELHTKNQKNLIQSF